MLDDIDREAMQEGQAISKLRGFQGSRDRTRREKIQVVFDDELQRNLMLLKRNNEPNRKKQ